MFINKSSAWVAAQIFQLVLFHKLMVENKIKNHTRKLTLYMHYNRFNKIHQAKEYEMLNFPLLV